MEHVDAETVRLMLIADARMLADLQRTDPVLAHAAQHDPPAFARRWQQLQQGRQAQEYERQRQIQALNDDPFDVEAQRKIEEIIRQEAIVENLNNAVEHHPESFGQVHMLYVPLQVNGHEVKAFVDSGAQATIMSPKCAEVCHLMHLVDTRYAGTAHGVGTAKILGRVHSAQIKLGNLFLSCSFTILEGETGPEMLLGLDMLKRHQACIDLASNSLRIGSESVAFLPEHALPASAQPPAPVPPPQPELALDKVQQLEAMGFSRAECIQALEATNGSVEEAAGLLL